MHEDDDVPVRRACLLDVEVDVVRLDETTGEGRESPAVTRLSKRRGADRENGGERGDGDKNRQAP